MLLSSPPLLPRPELLSRLSRPEVGVSRLIAGRGYGKTTLLAALAERPGYHYLTLWDADPDPLSIIRLICTEVPELADGQLAFELGRAAVTDRSAATALRHDLGKIAPVTLLIDDANGLTSEGKRLFADHLLGRLPPQVRFIFAMHDEDDLPLRSVRHRLQLNRIQLDQLTEEDLMFTPTEMAAFGLDAAAQRRVAGWPAAALFAAGGEDTHRGVRDLLLLLPQAEQFLPVLRRAAVLQVWREAPEQAAMGLPTGWLAQARRLGVPMVQLDGVSYAPHPIVQDVLLQELQGHPDEYAVVQRGMAATLEHDQPLAAVQAYLSAGERGMARNLLLTVLKTLSSSEQLASVRELLRELVSGPEDELYLTFAEALFDAGALVQGLAMTQEVLNLNHNNQAAHMVMGNMRQRTGNARLASEHLTMALGLTKDPHLAVRLRARLALSLALQVDDPAGLVRVEREVDQLLSHVADFEVVLLARTALALSLAGRGRRTEARTIAYSARDYAEGLSADADTLLALIHLTNFMSDDGDEQAATELLGQIEAVHSGHGDLHLQLLLSRSRLAFRQATPESLQQCKTTAMQALELAGQQQNTPARLEALTYLFLLATLPDVQATHDWSYDQLLKGYGSHPRMTLVAQIVRDLGMQGRTRERFPSLGDLSVPADFRCLLTVYQLNRQPKDTELLEEVRNLRNRLGPGVVAGYARLLRAQLPQHLGETRLNMNLLTLRPVPEVRVQGEVITMRNGLLPFLLALAQCGRLSSDDMASVFGQGMTPANFRRTGSDLKQVLSTIAPDPLGDERGVFSLGGWRLELDCDQLLAGDPRTLERTYQACVFAAFEESKAPPFLKEMRRQVRKRVVQKISEIAAHQPQEARQMLERLQQRDRYLGGNQAVDEAAL